MPSIAVAFASQAGHTKKLADAIASGLASDGETRPALIDVTKMDDRAWGTLNGAHAIVFGSPTFMGGVSAGFKQFMDETSDFWEEQRWQDKLAAGFTVGSRLSGDKLATLQHLAIFAAQHGIVWIGQGLVGDRPQIDGPRMENGDGSWLGLMATAAMDKSVMIPSADVATASRFGARIAKAARRWQGGQES